MGSLLESLPFEILTAEIAAAKKQADLNFLKNKFMVELKIDTEKQKELQEITKTIKDFSLETLGINDEIESCAEKLTERRTLLKEQVRKETRGKTDEEIGEAFINKIKNDQGVREGIKESNKNTKRLKEIDAQKKYLEQSLIIAGIARGIKL